MGKKHTLVEAVDDPLGTNGKNIKKLEEFPRSFILDKQLKKF